MLNDDVVKLFFDSLRSAKDNSLTYEWLDAFISQFEEDKVVQALFHANREWDL
jgi:hypothetical protein